MPTEKSSAYEYVALELMTPWNPMELPAGKDDYVDVPAKPPREALGEMIENYRSLN